MRSLNRITGSLILTALLGACGQPMNADEDVASTAGTGADMISGVLEIAVVDLEDSAYHMVGLRTSDGTLIPLRVRDDQIENFRTGDPVSVLGVRSGNEIDITSGGSLLASQADIASSRSALVQNGPRNTAVVLFNFRNDTTQPLSKAQAQTALFSATDSLAAYYKEISNSAISLVGINDKVNGDAYGYYTIDADNTNCQDPFGWTDKVDALAKAQGTDLSKYTNVIYISPDAASCGWAGIAYVPGRKAIIKASAITKYPKVVAHEFGHNMGFAHANVFHCKDAAGKAVPLSASCATEEYGDILDPMGIGTPRPPTHTNIRNKADASWMGSRVTEVRTSGEYSFSASNVPATGSQGVRIPRADGTFLWLETRTMAGFDALSINNANHAAYKGVTIRVAKESGTVASQLVDSNPSTSSVDDAPFLPGNSLVDAQNKITVTVLSVAGGVAKVKVDMTGAAPPPPPPATQPTVPPPASTDPVVRLTSVLSKMPMSVVGASTAAGAEIDQEVYAAQTSQHMRLQAVQGGYLIRPMNSSLCLEIAAGNTTAGTKLVQATCTGNTNQRFLPKSSAGGYSFRNASSNLCLDIAGGSSAAGARIVQQTCSAATSQAFILYLAK